MNDRNARRVILAFAVAFALAPVASNGFGGFLRDSFPVQVARWPAQPVGWAFAIWGPIYLGLIGSAALAVLRPASMPHWGRAVAPLGLSLCLGLFWIEAALRAPVLATVMIVPMAAGAIAALWRVGPGWREQGALGLYAGWLTAASGVAVAAVLAGYGLAPPRGAAVALIVAVLVVALAVARARPGIWSYRAGVIWALLGVVVANLAAQDWLIAGLCVAGAIALIALPQLWPAHRARG